MGRPHPVLKILRGKTDFLNRQFFLRLGIETVPDLLVYRFWTEDYNIGCYQNGCATVGVSHKRTVKANLQKLFSVE